MEKIRNVQETGRKDLREINAEIAKILSRNKELLAYRQELTELAVNSQVSRIYSKSRDGSSDKPTINTEDVRKLIPDISKMYASKEDFEKEVQSLGKKAIAEEEKREREEEKAELEDLQEIIQIPDWLDDPKDLSQEQRQQRKKEVKEVKRSADEFARKSTRKSNGKDFETEHNKLIGALASLYIDHYFNDNSGTLLITCNLLDLMVYLYSS